jgi:xylan 1,4-beta-xylosidase
MEWSSDGWPRATGGTLSTPMPKPRNGVAGPAGFALSDDFSTNKFGVQWSFFNPQDDEMKRVRYGDRALVLSAKGETLADCSPLTFIVGDRSYEAEITLAVGDGAQAGLSLFYSDRGFCGIGFSKKQMFTYNYSQEQTWMRQKVSNSKVRVKFRNEENVVTFHYAVDDGAWIQHPWQMEVSGFHHNVFGGFLSLKPAIFCTGTGEVELRDFVYKGL